MAGVELLLGAHVQHHALVTVDQCRQFAIAQALATLACLGDEQKDQQHYEQAAEYIVVRDKFNQVSEHQRVPGR